MGLLTYSSVGLSKTIIMECGNEIYRHTHEENTNFLGSVTELSNIDYRSDGQWKNWCTRLRIGIFISCEIYSDGGKLKIHGMEMKQTEKGHSELIDNPNITYTTVLDFFEFSKTENSVFVQGKKTKYFPDKSIKCRRVDSR